MSNIISEENKHVRSQVELRISTSATKTIATKTMIDLVDIKRDIETLGDRLGKTQDYL
jgi:hypothetical protein